MGTAPRLSEHYLWEGGDIKGEELQASGERNNGLVTTRGRLIEHARASRRIPRVKRQLPMARVAGHGVDADVPVARHLNRDVRGGAEALHGEASTGLDAGKPQGAEADDSGA